MVALVLDEIAFNQTINAKAAPRKDIGIVICTAPRPVIAAPAFDHVFATFGYEGQLQTLDRVGINPVKVIFIVFALAVVCEPVEPDDIATNDDNFGVVANDPIIPVLAIEGVIAIATDQHIPIDATQDRVIRGSGRTCQGGKVEHSVIEHAHEPLIPQHKIGIMVTLLHDICLIGTTDNLDTS